MQASLSLIAEGFENFLTKLAAEELKTRSSFVLFIFLIFQLFCLQIHEATAATQLIDHCSEACTYGFVDLPLPGDRLSFSNDSNAVSSPDVCSSKCQLSHCVKGCSSWSLENRPNCSLTCTEFACLQGCQFARNDFLTNLSAHITSLIVTKDSTGSTVLSWQLGTTFDNYEQQISFLLHWRQQKQLSSDYCFNSSVTGANVWNVVPLPSEGDLLLHRKNGQFTVQLKQLNLNDPSIATTSSQDLTYDLRIIAVVFKQLVAVSPVASGVRLPKEDNDKSPVPVAITAQGLLTTTQGAVCWQALDGVTYNIKLQQEQSAVIRSNEPGPCFVFEVFDDHATVLELTAEDDKGSRSAVTKSMSFVAAASSSSSASTATSLIYATSSGVFQLKKLQDFFVSDNPGELYRTSAGATITAIGSGTDEVFIALSNGQLLKVSVQENTDNSSPASILTAPSAILCLGIDRTNEKIYYSTSSQLFRTNYNGSNKTEYLFPSSVTNLFLRTFLVDELNGYLYILSSACIYRFNLEMTDHVTETAANKNYCVLNSTFSISGTATLGLDQYFGVLFPKNDTVYRYSLESASLTDIRSSRLRNNTKRALSNVVSLAASSDKLFWIKNPCDEGEVSASGKGCLYGEEISTNPKDQAGKLNSHIYLLPQGHDKLQQLLILQPLPMPMLRPPRMTGLFCDSTTAVFSWNLPNRFPFQSSKEWRKLLFKLELLSDGALKASGDTTRLWFQFSSLQLRPNSKYVARVQACIKDTCSDFATASCFTTNKESQALLVSIERDFSSSKLLKRNVKGQELNESSISLGSTGPSVTAVIPVMVNNETVQHILVTNSGSVFQVRGGKDQSLVPMTGFANNSQNVTNAVYERFGEMLYYTVSDGLYRIPLAGTTERQLVYKTPSWSPPAWIELLPNRALVIIGGPYAIDGVMLTGASYASYYNCIPDDGSQNECDIIVGVTVDRQKDLVLFLLRSPGSPKVRLVTSSYAAQNTVSTQEMDQFPEILQMAYADDRLFFLTTDHMLATCSVHMEFLSIYPMKYVQGFSALSSYDRSMVSAPIQPGTVSNLKIQGSSIDYVSIRWDSDAVSKQQAVSTPQVFFNVTVTEAKNDKLVQVSITDGLTMILDSVEAGSSYQILVTSFTYWKQGPAVMLNFTTPAKAPEVPKNPRIYAVKARSFESSGTASTAIVFRWSPASLSTAATPAYESDEQFIVECWLFQPGSVSRDYIVKGVRVPANVHSVFIPVVNEGSVACQVKSAIPPMQSEATTPAIVATRSASGDAAPPQFVAVSPSRDGAVVEGELLSVDNLNTVYQLPQDSSDTQIVLLISRSSELFVIQNRNKQNVDFTNVYAVRVDQSASTYTIKLNNTPSIQAATIDWIGRRIFYVVNTAKQDRGVYMLGIEKRETKLILSVDVPIFDLAFDPLRSTLYWTVEGPSGFQVKIHSLEAAGHQRNRREVVLNDQVVSSCPPNDERIASGVIGVQVSPASDETYIVFVTANNLYRYNQDFGCELWFSGKLEGVNVAQIKQLFAVEDSLFILSQSGRLLYFNASNPRKQPIEKGSFTLSSNLFLSNVEYQRFPDKDCLLLPQVPSDFTVEASSKSASFQVVPPQRPSACEKVSMPSTNLTAKVKPLSEPNLTCSDCHINSAVGNEVTVDGLTPNTSYTVTLNWSNFYNFGLPPSQTTPLKVLRTTMAAVQAPEGVRASAVSPDTFRVSWKPSDSNLQPTSDLSYIVFYYDVMSEMMFNTSWFSCRKISNENVCSTTITGLNPDTLYTIAVGVRQGADPFATKSDKVRENTPRGPTEFRFVNDTDEVLVISWETDDRLTVQNCTMKYKSTMNDEVAWLTEPVTKGQNLVRLPRLVLSADHIKCRLICLYSTGYTFETRIHYFSRNGHPPARLDPPVIRDGYISWEPPDKGAEEIVGYLLQYREDPRLPWQNFSFPETHKNIPTAQFHLSEKAEFRIAARNELGLGEFSAIATTPATSKYIPALVGGCVAGIIISLAVIGVAAFFCRRKTHEENSVAELKRRQLSPQSMFPETSIRSGNGSDNAELLRQIPHAELKALPHVPRPFVTIARLLGKGAFGEVYEGLACNLPKVGPKTVRVAIKTLREGASDADRVKFLKEAILMGNFEHPNIVRLLGVCIQSDPLWIILELMEGGDLLSYLRSCRPTDVLPSQISLTDLLSIALDVARGCEYLEQHHHVHRDLAGRNCLISSREPNLRVVKIADFGLARDIYEGDYYRVEGHGLLPVRWMAPESMIDALFTMKSDVWSFGILLWEIMTLGQQPYPGRTNWDVINYVRLGGKPDAPDFCPIEVYDIMSSCWGFNREDRPTFAEICGRIETLRNDSRLLNDAPFPPTKPQQGYVDSEHGSNSIPVASRPPLISEDSTRTRGASSTSTLMVGEPGVRVSDTPSQISSQSQQSIRSSTPSSTAGGLLRSFRKEKKRPPNPPPSKQMLESIAAASTRPSSSASSTFSGSNINQAGLYSDHIGPHDDVYEMPLMKLTAATNTQYVQRALAQQQATEKRPKDISSSTSSAPSRMKKTVPIGGAGGGVYNPAFEPITPTFESPSRDIKQEKPEKPASSCSNNDIPELDGSPRSLPRARRQAMDNKYVPSPSSSFNAEDRRGQTRPVIRQNQLQRDAATVEDDRQLQYADVDLGQPTRESEIYESATDDSYSNNAATVTVRPSHRTEYMCMPPPPPRSRGRENAAYEC